MMTRKRFVKLMMSCGMNRNDAQKVCVWAMLKYKQHPEWGRFCYADVWDALHLFARAMIKLVLGTMQEVHHDRS